MRQVDIELVIPGLLDIPVAEFSADFLKDELPGLNYCITQANRKPAPLLTLDETIAECLGLGQRSLPMVQALHDNECYSAGRSMLLEPVYLKPDISNITVYPIERTPEAEQQTLELLADLQKMFVEEVQIASLNECEHLISFINLQAPDYYPHPLSILGKTINRYVEQAKSDLDWYRLLTEIQMFLHDHPVNQSRQANGAYPINSFWFWGGGAALNGSTDQVVYSDDALIRRFFKNSASRVTSLEEIAAFKRRSLVVSLQLFASLKSLQSESLEGILLNLEHKIFAPAAESVQRQGKTLRLRAGWQEDFELHPLHGWRFWRKRQSIDQLCAAESGLL